MAKYYVSMLLVRLVLPGGLLLSIALRPFGLSLIYLLLYLIAPLPQVPNAQTFKGCRGKFLLLILIISSCMLLLHVAWHSVLAAFAPYGSLLDQVPLVREIGKNLGLVDYSTIDVLQGVHYLAPELVMFFTSLFVYIAVKHLLSGGDPTELNDSKFQQYPMLAAAGKYIALFLIMFSGIMRPSVTSGIYYIVFMGAATAWALGKPLEKGFAVIQRCLMAIMGAHMIILVAYQWTMLMDLYPPSEDFARYFGLTKLVKINNTSFVYEVTDDHRWATLASPLVILFTYFFLGLESRELFKPKVAYEYINSTALRTRGSLSETSPLIRNISPSKQFSSIRSKSGTRPLKQDSTGSVVVPDEEESALEPSPEPSLTDDVISAIIDFFQVLIRSSYIATTVTMMAWSIMFHSWLAFVFLMWGNMVWLTRNQRSFMLKTSPVLVMYAMFLLIAQYVYGMNLTEEELPSSVPEINLKQLGLSRSEDTEPCIPLLIKSLFTCMFWVTLRQRIQEIREKRQSEVVADIAAPLQLTMSTAASVIEAQREEEQHSRLLSAFGAWLRAMCARYWIYVVVIMLFVIGITGERMTIFRILYMFLFLSFILMFQLSWYWWRRLMYLFWIIVIIYSMVNLILIYIYQFDNFSKIVEEYFYINERLQHDLGLEHYKAGDLFLKLLTPTLFLIMTIMQVHYFHRDFMRLSDPKTGDSSAAKTTASRPPSQGASTMKDDITGLPTENEERPQSAGAQSDKSTEQDISNLEPDKSRISMPKLSRTRSYAPTLTDRPSLTFKVLIMNLYKKSKDFIGLWIDKTFVYLDLHLVKVILISLMLLCVINVCAMHVPIMLMIAPACLMTTRKQRTFIHFISTLISVYLMAKMVYQIDYIKHNFFDVNCTGVPDENGTLNTTTYNNAEWVGFEKTSKGLSLVVLCQGYIAMIALFTFYSLVTYRQKNIRALLAQPPRQNDRLMFPNIKREDADKDMIHCVQYLFNYGFYKFGVEITLICLMGVIGSRMDVYAVIYSVWLLVLVSISRQRASRVWGAFTVYVTLIIPIQYVIAVGVMPQICVNYPWSGDAEQMKHIRTWLFLPYQDAPPHASKLIFDFFLLIFASRQRKVFNIERNHGDQYVGGSNSEDTGKDWETINFVNPVPDFLGYIATWLDVIKRMVFLGMLWVTLAIMFLTGTNRVNLFSMGYLVGSFIFLWQGTDFYLRPRNTILQWWSWLLRYNVSVVVIKALLQIPGCIFSAFMQEHACWLVQLLGIGCVDKFAGGNITQFLKMRYIKVAVCSVPQEDIGLAWDGVCFAFLILQRRLFHSYYFFRVIDESKATTVLASRGAELIEELRQKQMLVQEDQEVKILEKIKVKMERIKANQKKIQGSIVKDPKHHDRDDEDEDDTQPGESDKVPLVRGDSDASGRGYHTPQSPGSPKGFHTPISESDESAPSSRPHTPPIKAPPPPPLPTLPAPTSSHGGPPSPSSALMTVSLDAYLEPRRISFESPASSELLRRAQSPEESYPVFSPPPIRRRHTVASPSFLQRTSIISQSSRAEPHSHHTCDRGRYRPPTSHQKAVRSGDYYMFDEFDDTEAPLRGEESSSDDDEGPPRTDMGLGELLSTALKTDLKHAVTMQRRASMPAIRRASRRPSSAGAGPHSYSHEFRRQVSRPEEDVQSTGERPHEDMSMLEDYASQAEHETLPDKLRRYAETGWAFISSILVSLTRHLMKYSRDYRYVSRTLSVEKKILKESDGFGIGLREGSQMIWEPLPETIIQQQHRKLSDISVPEIRILAPSMEGGLDATPESGRRAIAVPQSISCEDDDGTSEHESMFSLQTTSSKDLSTLEEQDDSLFRQEKNPFVHLAYALWYAIIAHTDIVCYIMVFINQIQSATILSIPLPLMVFLWGTLTIPRPTKTFWVTLIAYTEVIVLIKSMFQFEILPWNQKAIPANMPFTAPRIIGIERKSNYALYDLLLLLIIFLHRFMLKSLGLWKESAPDIEIHEEVHYHLTPEDTQLVVRGQGEEVGRKYIQLCEAQSPLRRLMRRYTLASSGRQFLDWSRLTEMQRKERLYLIRDKIKGKLRSLRASIRNVQSSHKGSAFTDTVITATNELKDKDDAGDQAGPSKQSDDDHYEVNDDQEPIIAVTMTLEDTYNHYPQVILLSLKRYLRPVHTFFRRVLEPGARVTADVYAYMFMCDFVNFMVVIFGFAAFGTHQGDGGVQAYLEENKVPIPFLIMLILQFGLIVIDRALYLRKFILGKILFQYALIIGVHVWMFFVLPFITERTFNALLPPPMWYMMKCVYLLLSAYQIRCGYPRRIIGNFLCKSYRFLNMTLFRGFMAVPFVFELRTLMDWIWTDTSMTLMDWLKMEDIFASVFLLKCSRYMEDEFPSPRGAKKSTTTKYLLGGSVLAFVIAIIWFPLVFFAFGNTVGEPNPPTDVTVKIRIGPFLPVYQMSAQSHNILVYTEAEYSTLSNLYARDRTAQTFLSNYMYNDVAVVQINPISALKWEISPPELDRLEKEATSNSSILVRFSFIITHPSNSAQNPPTIEDSKEVTMEAYINGKRNPERDKLLQLLAGTASEDVWLNVKGLFPKFLKVFNKGTAKPAYQLTPSVSPNDDVDTRLYRDVQLRLERSKEAMYWRVRETCEATTPDTSMNSIPLNSCDMLVMYTFNDKLFPETLNFISGSGIIGLYTTFVFLASRVLRGFFSGIYTKIMFDDLPNVDRVLQLCLDIYLVREALELTLEEDLFAKLVFLYRSPETMIKWSRPREDENEEQRALPPSR